MQKDTCWPSSGTIEIMLHTFCMQSWKSVKCHNTFILQEPNKQKWRFMYFFRTQDCPSARLRTARAGMDPPARAKFRGYSPGSRSATLTECKTQEPFCHQSTMWACPGRGGVLIAQGRRQLPMQFWPHAISFLCILKPYRTPQNPMARQKASQSQDYLATEGPLDLLALPS